MSDPVNTESRMDRDKRREALTDEAFLDETLRDAHWLFYGDLDEYFAEFVCSIFGRLDERPSNPPSFSPFGFTDGVQMEKDYAVAYWLFLSELCMLGLAEYGTSPRGAWLTPAGVRFRRIVMERRDDPELWQSPNSL